MGPRYYVIATLGTAPAVLTELLWILVTREDADVVGLEIWTTGGNPPPKISGQSSLRTFDLQGGWTALIKALGDRHDRVPVPLDQVPITEATDTVARGGRVFCLQQVDLHDIWFPRLRSLFAAASMGGGSSLLDAFDHQPYRDLVQRIIEGETRARLHRVSATRWMYRVSNGTIEETIPLPAGRGNLLAALILHPAGMTAKDVFEWGTRHGLIEDIKESEALEDKLQNIRKAFSRLVNDLSRLRTRGMVGFIPEGADRPGRAYRLPAADRVEFDPRDLDPDHAARP